MLSALSGCNSGSSMPRSQRRQSFRLCRNGVAAPDDVQVGPQQQEIAAADVARMLVRNVEDLQRCGEPRECVGERRGACLLAAKTQQAIAVPIADAVEDGRPVAQP